MTKTESKPAYRVVAPLIQIQSHTRHTAPERHLYVGAVLPGWVEADEIERLRHLGYIEEVR